MKTKISVPEDMEKLAISRGAKYDKNSKMFYVPGNVVISIFNKFIPLTIELVPSTTWNNNVRSQMVSSWDDLRRASYRLAGYRCEICNGVGETHPVECHEIWEFDIDKKVQILTGLISLCPMCHKAKHIGLAFVKGEEKEVIEHIKKINNWNNADVNKYIGESFQIHNILSEIDWVLDLSYVDTFMKENK